MAAIKFLPPIVLTFYTVFIHIYTRNYTLFFLLYTQDLGSIYFPVILTVFNVVLRLLIWQ